MRKKLAYRIRPEVLDKIRTVRSLPSDEALARELGLSLGTVQNIRSGRQPRLDVAIRIMDAADVVDIRAATAIA